MESRTARWLIRFGSVVALLFLYVPLVIVVLYAFNDSIGQKWPISHFTTKYFSLAWHNTDLREALINSLLIASVATVLALAPGQRRGVRRAPLPLLRTELAVVRCWSCRSPCRAS